MNAIVILRPIPSHFRKNRQWWATVRIENTLHREALGQFCYDTQLFSKQAEAKQEAQAFCRWKGLRIRRYLVRDDK